MKGFYLLLGVVALGGFGALAWLIAGPGAEPVTRPVPLSMAAGDVQALIEQAEGIELGDPTAPVRVIEFADYQCPACAVFAARMTPVLKERYIEPGRIRFTFFDYPIIEAHPNAFLAARAARCAGDQDRYWDYADVLYARQGSWSPERSPVGTFVDYARQLGMDEGAFETCLRSDRHAAAVTAGGLLGEQLGVRGTPTVIVNGQQVSDWGETPDVIERALGVR